MCMCAGACPQTGCLLHTMCYSTCSMAMALPIRNYKFNVFCVLGVKWGGGGSASVLYMHKPVSKVNAIVVTNLREKAESIIGKNIIIIVIFNLTRSDKYLRKFPIHKLQTFNRQCLKLCKPRFRHYSFTLALGFLDLHRRQIARPVNVHR